MMIITKKNILSLLFMFANCVTFAQVQNNPPMRQVLAATGGTKTLAFGTIDYTVGECMVTTYSSAAPAVVKVITQGFEQPLTASDTTKTILPFKFYTGITPNGDGKNDTWEIDGITKFPDNTVSLFNRWGDKIWNGKNYDNVNVVWSGKNNSGELLPNATYFFVIDADGKTYKGWVELTK